MRLAVLIGVSIVLSFVLIGGCASSGAPIATSDQAHAVVRGDVGRRSEGIYPVTIVNIDGQEIPARKGPVSVTPGKHRFVVLGGVDLRNAFGTSVVIDADLDQSIEIDVQQGVTYYLGAEAQRNTPKRWRPVVWKQEE